MELDERKEKILKIIIQTYLETGEPVGSRTISKYADMNLSSATIRNEMSDLEEMGYIVQPHTSAGRIPSDLGYRFYVDQIIKEKDKQVSDMEELILKRVDRVEVMLEQMAKLLAANTNYATLISGPNYHKTKLKFIQLSRVEGRKFLIVVVIEGNIIRNSLVTLDEDLTDEEILNLNVLLNKNLNGLTIHDIDLDIIARLKEEAGSHRQVVDIVLDEISVAIDARDEEFQVYSSGTTNIFKYPELADTQRASELLSTLQQKDLLKELLDGGGKNADPGTDIQVYIGEEMPVESMKDCSVVTANYALSDGLRGIIGIVGPRRMDYEKVVTTLRSLIIQLRDAFKKEGGDG